LLVGLPNTYCLFALHNNSIAAMAALYVHQDIGYLALAATRPTYRNRGCHKALLQARITLAANKGCTCIAGQAAFGSASQQNMEKIGLRIAYTKALWTKFDKQGAAIPPR
jgi:GNAT superfamily N-acetyltransferase